MAGKLTTHVLDTARGKPAAGLHIDLWRSVEGKWQHLGRYKTNDDGRISKPLLEGEQFQPGIYELRFHVGDYQRSQGHIEDREYFLDEVPVQFGLAASEHYHVPLLVSPFGYSTYRGS